MTARRRSPIPATAGTRRQLARAGLIGLAGLAAAGMSACGSSGGAATSGGSAASLLAAALHNAVTSRGVHELAQAHGAGRAVAMVNEIGPTSGRQVIDAAGGHSVVIVSGGRAYFRGDAIALAGYYQFPVTVALEYAGKWISMGSKEPGYGRVSGAVTLASDFGQIAINGPLTARPVTLPDGQRAVAIAGTAKGPTGTEVPATLDVTAAGTTLPIRLREGHGKVSAMVAWSRWGQPVAFVAPVGATPISGLGRTPGTGAPTQTPTRA